MLYFVVAAMPVFWQLEDLTLKLAVVFVVLLFCIDGGPMPCLAIADEPTAAAHSSGDHTAGGHTYDEPAVEHKQTDDRGAEDFLGLIKRANNELNAVHFIEAKKIYEAALIEGKKTQVNKPDLAVVMSDIAMVDKLTFHFEEAQDCLMDALPMAGDDQTLQALLHTRLSSVMRARGNFYGALEHAKTSVEIRSKIDAKSPQLAESLNNVAVLYLEMKNNKGAIDYCDQALALLKEAGKTGAAEEAAVLSTKAAALTEIGDYDGAKTLLGQVLANQEKLFGLNSPKLSSALNNLAMAYCKKNEYKEAEPCLIRALQLAETSKPQDIPGAADASANLADLYARIGDRPRADLNFKKAIKYSQAIGYRRLADIKEQYQSFLAGEFHPLIEMSPVLEKEPVIEPKPIVKQKPVIEKSPVIQMSPGIEKTPVIEQNPGVESSPAK
jgi:tetratricopeptide (TPR) repeat protein